MIEKISKKNLDEISKIIYFNQIYFNPLDLNLLGFKFASILWGKLLIFLKKLFEFLKNFLPMYNPFNF